MNNTISILILEFENMQSSYTIPILPILRITESSQTPLHIILSNPLVTNSFILKLSHEIWYNIEESNIIDRLYIWKLSKHQ